MAAGRTEPNYLPQPSLCVPLLGHGAIRPGAWRPGLARPAPLPLATVVEKKKGRPRAVSAPGTQCATFLSRQATLGRSRPRAPPHLLHPKPFQDRGESLSCGALWQCACGCPSGQAAAGCVSCTYAKHTCIGTRGLEGGRDDHSTRQNPPPES